MENNPNDWYLPHRVKFYLLLTLQIPSLTLCLFIFTFFLLHNATLRRLQYKALLILFIVNFIQLAGSISMNIHFFRLSRVNPATAGYCKWWMFLEDTLDAVNELLVSVISIQRHSLIFQPNRFHRHSIRYLFYYLPLFLCIIYPIAFYMATVVFYSCANDQWDFNANSCGNTACYLSDNEILATFDWIVNTGLPMLVILSANVALIIRVIRQKYRRQQVINWPRQQRMTLQLLSLSSLYLVAWAPSIIVGLMQQLSPSDLLNRIQEDYISDLTFLISILLPWISIGLVPDFQKWISRYLRRLRRSQNAIRPA